MGLDFEYSEGQTPLDEEEREGLLIPSITTRGELDEFEQLGVGSALAWTMQMRPRTVEILTEGYVLKLHGKMFEKVWRWAGRFRSSNKNIGIDKTLIRTELKQLFDDCRFWIEHGTYPPDEIAVRLSHRLVSIHPFTNGNGRHSRLMADVLAVALGRPPFSWGGDPSQDPTTTREQYLSALRDADRLDYIALVEFARS